jgi:hypothetical protein
MLVLLLLIGILVGVYLVYKKQVALEDRLNGIEPIDKKK